jgi:hypothetical protein
MKEQNFPTSRESGTSFENGGQVDLHAANPNLISQAELERRRRQAVVDQEILRLMGVAPERPQPTVHEQIGIISVNLTRFRAEERQGDDYELAA